MDEVNAIGRGTSFDLNNLKKIKGPTFLISFWVPLRLDKEGNMIYVYENIKAKTMSGVKHPYNINNTSALKEFKKQNMTYVIARPAYVKLLKDNGHNVLAPHGYYIGRDGKIFAPAEYTKDSSYMKLFNNDNCRVISMIEKIYRPPVEKTVIPMDLSKPLYATTPVYSFLPHLCSLTFFAKKINVYGWDFYLKMSPEKMNYWQLFFSLFNFKLDTRSRNHFEGALINFYYGYQFSKMPNFKIYGYMGKLGKHEKLIRRIERVLFN